MGREKLTTKGQRDKLKVQQRLSTIKYLNAQPVLRKLNIEAIVAEFDKKSAQDSPKATTDDTTQGASTKTASKKLTTKKTAAKPKAPIESTPKT